ncbi:MAG: DNA topoisomerase IB, partial [Ramlibacter sp.]
DFRTWHGSVLALETQRRFCGAGRSFTLKELLAQVSGSLGNTPAVCRKAYIHPRVLALGIQLATRKEPGAWEAHAPAARPIKGLAASEQRLVAYLNSV